MNRDYIPLTAALPGKEYTIKYINNGETRSSALKGYGVFPGTKITMLFSGPLKTPFAYEIMGTVIALRYDDAANIYISSV